VDAFHFQTPEQTVINEPAPPIELALDRPVTVRHLYEGLKIGSAEVLSDLFSLGATFQLSTDLVRDDVAKEVALKHGIVLRIGGESESMAEKPMQQVPRDSATEQQLERAQRVSDSKDSLDSNLSAFLDAPRFPWHANTVRRYLVLLNWFIETVPNGRNHVLNYRREGASRRFFATSSQELAEYASSPNPHQIGGSGIWALTTTDSRLKREILDDLLRTIEISLPVREKAMEAMR
jgi:negative regulator of replication initiation